MTARPPDGPKASRLPSPRRRIFSRNLRDRHVDTVTHTARVPRSARSARSLSANETVTANYTPTVEFRARFSSYRRFRCHRCEKLHFHCRRKFESKETTSDVATFQINCVEIAGPNAKTLMGVLSFQGSVIFKRKHRNTWKSTEIYFRVRFLFRFCDKFQRNFSESVVFVSKPSVDYF